MKTKLLKSSASLLFGIIAGILNLYAQDQSGNFLKGGIDNGNKLINAYLGPTMKNFAQGINDGWNNTAKPLGTWGLDLRLNVGVGLVAVRDRTYNFNDLGLRQADGTYLRLPEGRDPNLPTLYGPHEANPPKIDVRGNVNGVDTSITMFTALNGVGSNYAPTLPILQLTVGIPLNTEIGLRYFPSIAWPRDFNTGLWGIAFKHDLVQWIPQYADLDLNAKRPFDLSVFAGYTNYWAQFKNALLVAEPWAYNPDPSVNYNNQRIVFRGNSWTAGLILSKEFNPWRPEIHVEPYVGVNYAYSNTNFRYEGDYPVPVANDEYSSSKPQVSKIRRVQNPTNLEADISNVRANIGVRFKAWGGTLSGEYSFGQINTVTLSLGINFQSLKPYRI
jgi:hypothetical protein